MIRSSIFKFVLTRPPLYNAQFYRFSQESPDPDPPQQPPKTKVTFGRGYIHPLKKIYLKPRRINQGYNSFYNFKAKQEQKENKEKIIKQMKKTTGSFSRIALNLFLGLLLYNTFFGEDEKNQKEPKVKKFEKADQAQSVKQHLMSLPNNSYIKIIRSKPDENKIQCNFRIIKILNDENLVNFLELLEKQFQAKNFAVSFYYKNRLEPFEISLAFNIFFHVVMFYIMFRFIKKRLSADMKNEMNKMQMRQKFQPIKPDKIQIYFKDVAGLHEAKFQVTQFVDFLKKSEKYIEMGAKVPKGALLTGPPGTGKTLLAKACAGEAGVPFYYVSGSDFVEKYVGLGASRVRNLFNEAQKNSPSIIFIDEIDAIGKKRDSGPFSNEQRDNTLNQLLVKMDGFDTQNKVIVMAATNRKDMLDPALLRPGRFDRTIEINVPNFEERQQILKVHLKKVKYDPSLSQDELAKKVSVLTPGFSGAELANVCNQAAILAARQNKKTILLPMFEKATERVMAGLEKRNMFSQEQKQLLAVYQCGKAVTSWFTEGSDPIIKISILPFSKSGKGYAHSIMDETSLNTKEQLLAKACCYLAGRAAENHFKGYITTNGDKDLKRAQRIITLIVTKFGMSDSLKMIAFPDIDFTKKPYSQKIQSQIDQEITQLTQECQKRVQKLILQKQSQIIELKHKLMEKETLTYQCIKQVLGERPAGQNQNYQIFMKEQEKEQQKKEETEEAMVGVDHKLNQV